MSASKSGQCSSAVDVQRSKAGSEAVLPQPLSLLEQQPSAVLLMAVSGLQTASQELRAVNLP